MRNATKNLTKTIMLPTSECELTRYTNAYLLLNYGFSYRDNKYDQFDISLRMRPASQTPQDIVEWNWEKCTDIQLVSLKVEKIDPTLICYLRLLIQAESMFQTDQ